MEFDDLFQYFGDIGRYQVFVLFLLSAPTLFSNNVALNFLTARLPHWCRIPALQNLTESQQKHVSVPHDDNGNFDQCHMYDLNFDSYDDEDFLRWNRTLMGGVYNSSGVSECQAWNYDHSIFTRTTVSEFDLVCGKSNLIPLPGTLMFAGALIGTLVSGFLSDRIGRKKVYFSFMLVRTVGGILSAVSPAYWIFCIGKFLDGFASNGCYVSGYLISMELLGPRFRVMVAVAYPLMSSISYLTTAGLAYIMRDYRVYSAVTVALTVVVFLACPIIPDPPRWLIQHDQIKESLKVYRRLARINNIKPPEDLEGMLLRIRAGEVRQRNTGEKERKERGVVDYYKQPTLLLRALAINFHWFTDSMMYYALSLNVGSLAGNMYVNTCFLGLVEFPSMFVNSFLLRQRHVGRRYVCFGAMFAAGLSGICMVPIILTNYVAPALALKVLSLLGKTLITMAFDGIYVLTAETYPTEVRHTCMAVSSACARVGGMIAPYMGPPMAQVWPPLPSLIFGSCATLSGLFILVVPETLGQPMCQTIEEAAKRTVSGSGRVARSNKNVVIAETSTAMEDVADSLLQAKQTEQ